MERKRIAKSFKFDEGLDDLLRDVAKERNTSANKLFESIVFEWLKKEGKLPEGFELLGETRGGNMSKK